MRSIQGRSLWEGDVMKWVSAYLGSLTPWEVKFKAHPTSTFQPVFFWTKYPSELGLTQETPHLPLPLGMPLLHSFQEAWGHTFSASWSLRHSTVYLHHWVCPHNPTLHKKPPKEESLYLDSILCYQIYIYSLFLPTHTGDTIIHT